MLRTWAGALLSMLLLVMLGSGCSQSQSIKIGYVAGLTGRLADLGVGGRNGALIAVEEINATGGVKGRKLELVIRDDNVSPDKVIQVDQELIDSGVVVIVGHATSAPALTAVPLMNSKQILMISPTVRTSQLTGRDDYFFSLITPIAPATDKQAEYAFRNMGIHRITTVYDLANQQYGQDWVGGFKRTFNRLGGEITGELTLSSTDKVNYAQLSEQILSTGATGVLLVAGAVDSAMLCQHLRKSGTPIAIFTSSWPVANEFIQLTGDAARGIVMSSPFFDDDPNPAFRTFRTKYSERFGNLPNYAAVYSYEAIYVIAAALETNDDPKHLKETILQRKTFMGLTGSFEFDTYGDTIRGNYLLTVSNGRFEKLE